MVLLAVPVLVLVTVFGTSPAVGSADAFTGAWVATDPDDGSTLRVQIGAANGAGVRRVTLIDQFASACGAAATAIGSGTVSRSTLTATLNVRCGGEPLDSDVLVDFAIVGDTLVGFGVVWRRAGD
jgi:hypothetical protein